MSLRVLERRLQRIAAVALALLLASCQTVSTPPPGAVDWRQQRDWAQSVDRFVASGRLASPNGSGNFSWRQNAGWFDIRLSGPLGQGALQLVGDERSVQISHGGETRTGAADLLVAEALAAPVSVSDLMHWARGVPNPERPLANESTDGRTFEQSQWRVRVERLIQAGPHRWLPGKLVATRLSGAPLRIVLIVDRWQLEE